MSRWPNVALGEVLTKSDDWILIDPECEYKEVTVRNRGQGAVLRRIVTGAEIAGTRRMRVHHRQFIVSRIDARHGSSGVIPAELEGAIVTNDFPVFECDTSVLLPEYLGWYTKTPRFVDECRHASEGSTNRVRLKELAFLEITMSLPPIEEQRRVVEKLNRLADMAHRGERQMASTGLSMRALVPARLNELASTWSRRGTLADVLTGKPRNGWSARCDGDPAGVAVLALGAVTGFDYRAREHKRTSLPTDPGADYWLRPGDLLMTRSNTPELVGHAAIYDGTPAPCIYPDLVMRLPVDIGKALPRFVWYWLQSPIARKHVQMLSKGTSPTMAKIGQGTVMAMPFPAGIALETQGRLVAELDRLTELSSRAANVARRRNDEMAGVLLATLAELMGPA